MIKKIPVSQLKPGMRVIDPGLSQLDNPGIFCAEVEIETLDQVTEISAGGFIEAFIDAGQGAYFAEHPEAREEVDSYYSKSLVGKAAGAGPPRRIEDMAQTLDEAENFYKGTLETIRDIVGRIENDRKVPMAEATTVVNGVIQKVTTNLDALVCVSKLQQFDNYTFTHCLNVSIYSAAFGKYLGLGEDNIRMLAYAGLFHDAGKVCVPPEILNKPGKLTVSEFEEIKKHPIQSYKMAADCPDLPAGVPRCCLEHHERYAGGGYPNGISYAQIGRGSSVIGVVDVFDALTSTRCYKSAMHGHKALSVIFNLKNRNFLPVLADKFIRFMGIYPIGSIVLLSNGSKAVVIEQNSGNLLRPKVRVVLDKGNRHCPVTDMDLSSERYIQEPEYEIEDCLAAEACRINVKNYLNP